MMCYPPLFVSPKASHTDGSDSESATRSAFKPAPGSEGTPITYRPAALAADTPVGESSNAADRSGAAPNRSHAVRYTSASGLGAVTSSPPTTTSKLLSIPAASSASRTIRPGEFEAIANGMRSFRAPTSSSAPGRVRAPSTTRLQQCFSSSRASRASCPGRSSNHASTRPASALLTPSSRRLTSGVYSCPLSSIKAASPFAQHSSVSSNRPSQSNTTASKGPVSNELCFVSSTAYLYHDNPETLQSSPTKTRQNE